MMLIQKITQDVRLRHAYQQRIVQLEREEDVAWSRYARLEHALNATVARQKHMKATKTDVRAARRRADQAHAIHGKIMREITLTHRAWLTYRAGLAHG